MSNNDNENPIQRDCRTLLLWFTNSLKRRPEGRICRQYAALYSHIAKVSNEEYHPSISNCIAQCITWYIQSASKKRRKTPEFLEDVKRKLFFLRLYNQSVIKYKGRFPYSEQLVRLLVQYIVLEFEVLFSSPNHDTSLEEEVENRITRNLELILFDSCKHGILTTKAAIDASSVAALKVLTNVKTDHGNENKLYKNIINSLIVKFLGKIGMLTKLEEIVKSKSFTSLQNPILQSIRQNLIENDYVLHDQFSISDDEYDDNCRSWDKPLGFESPRHEKSKLGNGHKDVGVRERIVKNGFPNNNKKAQKRENRSASLQKPTSTNSLDKNMSILTIEIVDDDDDDGIDEVIYLQPVPQTCKETNKTLCNPVKNNFNRIKPMRQHDSSRTQIAENPRSSQNQNTNVTKFKTERQRNRCVQLEIDGISQNVTDKPIEVPSQKLTLNGHLNNKNEKSKKIISSESSGSRIEDVENELKSLLVGHNIEPIGQTILIIDDHVESSQQDKSKHQFVDNIESNQQIATTSKAFVVSDTVPEKIHQSREFSLESDIEAELDFEQNLSSITSSTTVESKNEQFQEQDSGSSIFDDLEVTVVENNNVEKEKISDCVVLVDDDNENSSNTRDGTRKHGTCDIVLEENVDKEFVDDSQNVVLQNNAENVLEENIQHEQIVDFDYQDDGVPGCSSKDVEQTPFTESAEERQRGEEHREENAKRINKPTCEVNPVINDEILGKEVERHVEDEDEECGNVEEIRILEKNEECDVVDNDDIGAKITNSEKYDEEIVANSTDVCESSSRTTENMEENNVNINIVKPLQENNSVDDANQRTGKEIGNEEENISYNDQSQERCSSNDNNLEFGKEKKLVSVDLKEETTEETHQCNLEDATNKIGNFSEVGQSIQTSANILLVNEENFVGSQEIVSSEYTTTVAIIEEEQTEVENKKQELLQLTDNNDCSINEDNVNATKFKNLETQCEYNSNDNEIQNCYDTELIINETLHEITEQNEDTDDIDKEITNELTQMEKEAQKIIVNNETIITSKDDVNNETVITSEDDVNETIITSKDDVNNETIITSKDDVNNETIITSKDDVNNETIITSEDDVNTETVITSKDDVNNETVITSEDDVNNETIITSKDDVNNETVITSKYDVNNEIVITSEDDVNNETIITSNDDVNNETVITSEDDVNNETIITSKDDVNNETVITSKYDVNNETVITSKYDVNNETVITSEDDVNNETIITSNDDVNNETVITSENDVNIDEKIISETYQFSNLGDHQEHNSTILEETTMNENNCVTINEEEMTQNLNQESNVLLYVLHQDVPNEKDSDQNLVTSSLQKQQPPTDKPAEVLPIPDEKSTNRVEDKFSVFLSPKTSALVATIQYEHKNYYSEFSSKVINCSTPGYKNKKRFDSTISSADHKIYDVRNSSLQPATENFQIEGNFFKQSFDNGLEVLATAAAERKNLEYSQLDLLKKETEDFLEMTEKNFKARPGRPRKQRNKSDKEPSIYKRITRSCTKKNYEEKDDDYIFCEEDIFDGNFATISAIKQKRKRLKPVKLEYTPNNSTTWSRMRKKNLQKDNKIYLKSSKLNENKVEVTSPSYKSKSGRRKSNCVLDDSPKFNSEENFQERENGKSKLSFKNILSTAQTNVENENYNKFSTETFFHNEESNFPTDKNADSSKCELDDFTNSGSLSANKEHNKIFAQVAEMSATTDDSNDSYNGGLSIVQYDNDSSQPEGFKGRRPSIYDEKNSEEPLLLINTANKVQPIDELICISIPETEKSGVDEDPLLKQVEEFQDSLEQATLETETSKIDDEIVSSECLMIVEEVVESSSTNDVGGTEHPLGEENILPETSTDGINGEKFQPTNYIVTSLELKEKNVVVEDVKVQIGNSFLIENILKPEMPKSEHKDAAKENYNIVEIAELNDSNVDVAQVEEAIDLSLKKEDHPKEIADQNGQKEGNVKLKKEAAWPPKLRSKMLSKTEEETPTVVSTVDERTQSSIRTKAELKQYDKFSLSPYVLLEKIDAIKEMEAIKENRAKTLAENEKKYPGVNDISIKNITKGKFEAISEKRKSNIRARSCSSEFKDVLINNTFKMTLRTRSKSNDVFSSSRNVDSKSKNSNKNKPVVVEDTKKKRNSVNEIFYDTHLIEDRMKIKESTSKKENDGIVTKDQISNDVKTLTKDVDEGNIIESPKLKESDNNSNSKQLNKLNLSNNDMPSVVDGHKENLECNHFKKGSKQIKRQRKRKRGHVNQPKSLLKAQKMFKAKKRRRLHDLNNTGSRLTKKRINKKYKRTKKIMFDEQGKNRRHEKNEQIVENFKIDSAETKEEESVTEKQKFDKQSTEVNSGMLQDISISSINNEDNSEGVPQTSEGYDDISPVNESFVCEKQGETSSSASDFVENIKDNKKESNFKEINEDNRPEMDTTTLQDNKNITSDTQEELLSVDNKGNVNDEEEDSVNLPSSECKENQVENTELPDSNDTLIEIQYTKTDFSIKIKNLFDLFSKEKPETPEELRTMCDSSPFGWKPYLSTTKMFKAPKIDKKNIKMFLADFPYSYIIRNSKKSGKFRKRSVEATVSYLNTKHEIDSLSEMRKASLDFEAFKDNLLHRISQRDESKCSDETILPKEIFSVQEEIAIESSAVKENQIDSDICEQEEKNDESSILNEPIFNESNTDSSSFEECQDFSEEAKDESSPIDQYPSKFDKRNTESSPFEECQDPPSYSQFEEGKNQSSAFDEYQDPSNHSKFGEKNTESSSEFDERSIESSPKSDARNTGSSPFKKYHDPPENRSQFEEIKDQSSPSKFDEKNTESSAFEGFQNPSENHSQFEEIKNQSSSFDKYQNPPNQIQFNERNTESSPFEEYQDPSGNHSQFEEIKNKSSPFNEIQDPLNQSKLDERNTESLSTFDERNTDTLPKLNEMNTESSSKFDERNAESSPFKEYQNPSEESTEPLPFDKYQDSSDHSKSEEDNSESSTFEENKNETSRMEEQQQDISYSEKSNNESPMFKEYHQNPSDHSHYEVINNRASFKEHQHSIEEENKSNESGGIINYIPEKEQTLEPSKEENISEVIPQTIEETITKTPTEESLSLPLKDTPEAEIPPAICDFLKLNNDNLTQTTNKLNPSVPDGFMGSFDETPVPECSTMPTLCGEEISMNLITEITTSLTPHVVTQAVTCQKVSSGMTGLCSSVVNLETQPSTSTAGLFNTTQDESCASQQVEVYWTIQTSSETLDHNYSAGDPLLCGKSKSNNVPSCSPTKEHIEARETTRQLDNSPVATETIFPFPEEVCIDSVIPNQSNNSELEYTYIDNTLTGQSSVNQINQYIVENLKQEQVEESSSDTPLSMEVFNENKYSEYIETPIMSLDIMNKLMDGNQSPDDVTIFLENLNNSNDVTIDSSQEKDPSTNIIPTPPNSDGIESNGSIDLQRNIFPLVNLALTDIETYNFLSGVDASQFFPLTESSNDTIKSPDSTSSAKNNLLPPSSISLVASATESTPASNAIAEPQLQLPVNNAEIMKMFNSSPNKKVIVERVKQYSASSWQNATRSLSSCNGTTTTAERSFSEFKKVENENRPHKNPITHNEISKTGIRRVTYSKVKAPGKKTNNNNLTSSGKVSKKEEAISSTPETSPSSIIHGGSPGSSNDNVEYFQQSETCSKPNKNEGVENNLVQKHNNFGVQKHDNFSIQNHVNFSTQKHDNFSAQKHDSLSVQKHDNFNVQKHDNFSVQKNNNFGVQRHDNFSVQNHDICSVQKHDTVSVKTQKTVQKTFVNNGTSSLQDNSSTPDNNKTCSDEPKSSEKQSITEASSQEFDMTDKFSVVKLLKRASTKTSSQYIPSYEDIRPTTSRSRSRSKNPKPPKQTTITSTDSTTKGRGKRALPLPEDSFNDTKKAKKSSTDKTDKNSVSSGENSKDNSPVYRLNQLDTENLKLTLKRLGDTDSTPNKKRKLNVQNPQDMEITFNRLLQEGNVNTFLKTKTEAPSSCSPSPKSTFSINSNGKGKHTPNSSQEKVTKTERPGNNKWDSKNSPTSRDVVDEKNRRDSATSSSSKHHSPSVNPSELDSRSRRDSSIPKTEEKNRKTERPGNNKWDSKNSPASRDVVDEKNRRDSATNNNSKHYSPSVNPSELDSRSRRDFSIPKTEENNRGHRTYHSHNFGLEEKIRRESSIPKNYQIRNNGKQDEKSRRDSGSSKGHSTSSNTTPYNMSLDERIKRESSIPRGYPDPSRSSASNRRDSGSTRSYPTPNTSSLDERIKKESLGLPKNHPSGNSLHNLGLDERIRQELMNNPADPTRNNKVRSGDPKVDDKFNRSSKGHFPLDQARNLGADDNTRRDSNVPKSYLSSTPDSSRRNDLQSHQSNKNRYFLTQIDMDKKRDNRKSSSYNGNSSRHHLPQHHADQQKYPKFNGTSSGNASFRSGVSDSSRPYDREPRSHQGSASCGSQSRLDSSQKDHPKYCYLTNIRLGKPQKPQASSRDHSLWLPLSSLLPEPKVSFEPTQETTNCRSKEVRKS